MWSDYNNTFTFAFSDKLQKKQKQAMAVTSLTPPLPKLS